MSDPVSLTIAAQVAVVKINRPDKHNAVNLEVFEGLASAADRIASDNSIRAVVLSGAGDNFCAGIDTKLFESSGPENMVAMLARLPTSPANFFQRAAYAWREVQVPVICAVNGVAFGAGFQIALGADIRYASPNARFSIMEIKWGLIPDMAISATARSVIRADILRELAYTGRIVDAAEAAELGLVTRIFDDPVGRAEQLAQQIAGQSPDAIRRIKQLINDGFDATDADSLALEAKLQSEILGRQNQLEAVRANLEKRPPDFAD